MVADDGTTFTLRTVEREIWSSTGEILVLDGEEFDLAYAEFLGTLEADRLVPQLEALSVYSDPGCVPNPEQGVYCTNSVDPTAPPAEVDLSQLQWRFGSSTETRGSKRLKKKPAVGQLDESRAGVYGDEFQASTAHPTIPVSFASLTPETFNFAAMAAYQTGGVCSTIANYALPAVIEFRGTREDYLREAFAMGTFIFAGGVWKRAMGAGTAAGVRYRSLIADRAYTRIRIHILAFDWNTYNCHNRYVEVGPIYLRGSGGGGGSPICEWEMISISFNGGASWSSVNALVCMVQQPH